MSIENQDQGDSLMDETTIQTNLQEVFDSVFLEKVNVTRELSAKDVPEWDSLLHITLIVTVEQKFGIRFRTGEVEAKKTVGEFMDLIAQHKNKQ